MIIENVIARLNELEFELAAVKDRLARAEEVVAVLRTQTAAGAKTVTEAKAAPSPAPTTAKTAGK